MCKYRTSLDITLVVYGRDYFSRVKAIELVTSADHVGKAHLYSPLWSSHGSQTRPERERGMRLAGHSINRQPGELGARKYHTVGDSPRHSLEGKKSHHLSRHSATRQQIKQHSSAKRPRFLTIGVWRALESQVGVG